MKKVLALLTVLLSSNALSSGFELSMADKHLYRGEALSNENASVQFELNINDIFFDGIYTRAEFTTIELDLNDVEVTYRGDVGVGRRTKVTNFTGVYVDTSINYVANPVLREEDYSEARIELVTDWDLFGGLDFFVHGNYILNNSNDTYAGVGILIDDLYPVLDLRLSYNAFRFEDATGFELNRGNWKTNNVELNLDYNFWDNVSVFSTVSIGNTGMNRLEIDNEYNVGLKIRF